MKREIRFQGKKLEYTLIQAPRRDVLIQALEGNLTRVYAPKRMPLSEIDALVAQRAGEIRAMQQALAPAPLRSGECVRVEGRPRRLRLEKGTRESFLTETEWVLFCPDPENARQVRDRARSFLAEMALVRIRERLEVYAPRIGMSYGRVTVRNQRTRWGSCSAKGNLNFIQLAADPRAGEMPGICGDSRIVPSPGIQPFRKVLGSGAAADAGLSGMEGLFEEKRRGTEFLRRIVGGILFQMYEIP